MEDIDQLRERAYRADDEFHAECVRQFGADNAGSGRFDSPKHDPRTRAARERFHAAGRELTDALVAARGAS